MKSRSVNFAEACHWKLLASLCAITVFWVVPARAEICNYFTAAPSPDGYSYTIILQGDITSYISASLTEGNALVDPFTYVNDYIVGSGTSSVQVTLTGGNTQVVFTGSNPILPSYSFPQTGNKGPHFGLEPMNGGPPKLDVLSQQWNNLCTFSTISVEPPKSGSKYEIVFAETTDTSTSTTTGAWFEVPFKPSGHLVHLQEQRIGQGELVGRRVFRHVDPNPARRSEFAVFASSRHNWKPVFGASSI